MSGASFDSTTGSIQPGEGNGKREPLVIGLVNNMPDAALERTERQFRELLGAAGAEHDVRLRLFSFPELIRSEAARAYVAEHYEPIDELWHGEFDGLVVTGAEPRTPVLPDEVYWPSLTRLIDFANETATSTVWSCLAAHAVVLYLDGIQRRRLGEKISGVFRCQRTGAAPLADGLSSSWLVPHSRLNTLDPAPLTAAGYEIVSFSDEAGVDTFIRRTRALFVFYQGHPEYDVGALLREYRRDVGRFLAGTMERYPEMPRGYFDDETAEAFIAFRARAERQRSRELLADLPDDNVQATLARSWGDIALRLYRNWLSGIVAERHSADLSGAGAAAAARAT
ncbi:MAG TPA: homoserine O-succinyltransferase [Gemmatimonadaceae bacterium]|nr:homoserine O-succinyltransferase [Gemmatimonadaceae bacterium]